MDRQTVFNEVSKYLTHAFEVPEELITPEADLVEELNLDSIDAVDLMVKLQEFTGRKILKEDFVSVRTIDDVLNLVQRIHAEG
ncbi:MAG: acyl carrier protein [Caulobacterales bacterium]